MIVKRQKIKTCELGRKSREMKAALIIKRRLDLSIDDKSKEKFADA